MAAMVTVPVGPTANGGASTSCVFGIGGNAGISADAARTVAGKEGTVCDAAFGQ